MRRVPKLVSRVRVLFAKAVPVHSIVSLPVVRRPILTPTVMQQYLAPWKNMRILAKLLRPLVLFRLTFTRTLKGKVVCKRFGRQPSPPHTGRVFRPCSVRVVVKRTRVGTMQPLFPRFTITLVVALRRAAVTPLAPCRRLLVSALCRERSLNS